MEEIKLTYEFLFVGKEEDHFVQNYVYEHAVALGDTSHVHKKLFVNFGMLGNPSLAEEVGEVIFEALKQHFFPITASGHISSQSSDDEEGQEDTYICFEEALKAVNREIKRIQDEKEFKFQANLDVIVAMISGNTLYLSQAGEAEAYLIRRKLLSVVSEGLSSNGDYAEVFTNIATGVLEFGDILLFSSTRLLRYAAKSRIAQSFDQPTLPESLSLLKGALEMEISQKTGILTLKIENIREILSPAYASKKVLLSHHIKGMVDSVKNAVSQFKKPSAFKNVTVRRPQFISSDFFHITKDKVLAVVVVLVFILVVGVYLVHKRTSQQKYLKELELVLKQVEETISVATTKGNYNKNQAADLLNQAEKDALSVLNAGLLRAQATFFLDQIKSERDRLDNVVRITDPRVIADLTLKRSTVSALGLVSARGELFVYEYNALYRIVLDKIYDPVTIDENEIVVSGAYLEDKDALVFLTQSGQIIEYRDSLFFFMDTADQKWHSGVDINTYNTKIYILDPKENQIWRYTRKERDSYSAAEGYNLNSDVSKAAALAIDASIYVLNSDGGITKFYSGNVRPLRIDNPPMQSLEDAVALYTDKDISQVFVLDAGTNRILEYLKNAQSDNLTYSRQYLLSGVSELKDLYFDKKSQTLFVLDEKKVYQVNTR